MKTIFQARVSDNGKHLTNEEVIVDGKAFAGDRGISKVALSADGGSTWRFMAIMDSLFPYTRVVLTRQGMPSETGEFQFLVGATDGFIHRPFLYTGFWYGLLGGVIAWMAVIIILWWMDSSIQAFASLYDKSFHITGLTGSALLTMLFLSVMLGLVGSLISVQRHVREIEPQ